MFLQHFQSCITSACHGTPHKLICCSALIQCSVEDGAVRRHHAGNRFCERKWYGKEERSTHSIVLCPFLWYLLAAYLSRLVSHHWGSRSPLNPWDWTGMPALECPLLHPRTHPRANAAQSSIGDCCSYYCGVEIFKLLLTQTPTVSRLLAIHCQVSSVIISNPKFTPGQPENAGFPFESWFIPRFLPPALGLLLLFWA